MAEVAQPNASAEKDVHSEDVGEQLADLKLADSEKSEDKDATPSEKNSDSEEKYPNDYSYDPATGFGAAVENDNQHTHYATNNWQYDHRQRKEAAAIDTVTVDLVRRPDEGWGLKIIGSGPCYVEKVKPGGPADYAGVQAGDCILTVNGQNVLKVSHDQIVELIKEAGRMLRMKVLPPEEGDDESKSDNMGSDDEDGFGGKSAWTGGRRRLQTKSKTKKKGKNDEEKSWWCADESGSEGEKDAKEDKNKDPFEDFDPTDFSKFQEISDKFDRKVNKKVKSAADYDDPNPVDYDSEEELERFMKMKKKLKLLGKIQELDSDDEGGDVMDEFKEFMKYRHMLRSDTKRTFATTGNSRFDTDPLNRQMASAAHDKEWEQDSMKWNGTNYEDYCKNQERERNKRRAQYEEQKRRANAVQGRNIEYNGSHVEQANFIVTHDDAKKFDQEYEHEGTFQGRNAAVAGAFTGDHNIIFDERSGDTKGVANRVKAGIQHFNFEEIQDQVDEKDKGKILIYTTSLGVNRVIVSECQQCVSIIQPYRVRYEERDIYVYQEYKDDLYEKLGLDDGDPFPEIPRVYIDGMHIGGLAELQAMNDCGDLRIRLQDFSKYHDRKNCPICKGHGKLVCPHCNGKKSKKRAFGADLKCGTCDKGGHVKCPECMVVREQL